MKTVSQLYRIVRIYRKQALIHSNNAREDALKRHRSIRLSTHGIVFMGTPHQGGNGVELAEVVLNVAKLVVRVESSVLKHLRPNSEWLQQQLARYGQISSDFVTIYAYEVYQTPICFGKTVMVIFLDPSLTCR